MLAGNKPAGLEGRLRTRRRFAKAVRNWIKKVAVLRKWTKQAPPISISQSDI